jgi:murein DD-endopeptidase MepM/ murein hydrolase activator NlpD
MSKYRKVVSSLMLLILVAVFLVPSNTLIAEEGGEADIKELSSEIKDRQDDIEQLRKKIAAYEKSLDTERSKASSLKSQIYILETQIEKKQAEIELNVAEINATNLEIERTGEEIKLNTENVTDKQDKISTFLREMYAMDQKSDLEIVVMNSSISDFFRQLQATEKVQSEINDTLRDLKKYRLALDENIVQMEDKKGELEGLLEKLESRKGSLEDQQYTKQYLLDKTKQSESKYRNLVNELKLEQNRINSEIVALEKSIREKLSGDSSKLSELGDVAFMWPVPSQIVTSTFHDPDYPFRHIFEHPGIDVRAKQSTPLRASASGYVGKVRHGGKYGYSYIMIVHNDGFSTIYGHVSAIYVKTDQFVTQGEVIGATGGMPGTPGAGRLTTGPHLHFEIRKNGIPVNPLDYLP